MGTQVVDEQSEKGEGWSALADRRTSLLLASRAVVSEYYGRVDGSEYDAGWAGHGSSCESAITDWSFWVTGYWVTVPGRYMVQSGQ